MLFRSEVAIDRDLRRIFTALPDSLINHAVNDLPVSLTSDSQKLWVTKAGRVYGVEKRLFRPDATIEQMYDHHRRYFKNGRMTQAGTYERQIGRWIFIDKMVVRYSAYNRYLRYVREKMGILAGGWADAAAQLKVRMPKIALRHASGTCLVIEIGRAHV